VSVLLRDVSRVLTHELVRHRAGMAYSQESLRFVRAGSLGIWIPTSVRALGAAIVENFIGAVMTIERLGAEFTDLVNIDEETDFARKKVLTSLIRRLLPQGMATSILATGNLRAWRHIINMRCDEAAEEEMHVTIGPLARTLKDMYPSCFQDMELNEGGRWEFRINRKV
jgi:thymidylate synthase (FAD)